MTSSTADSSTTDSSTTDPSTVGPQAETDDLHLGSFSEHGPWSLAKTPPTWLADVDRLRAEQVRLVPQLVKRPRLPPVVRAVTVGSVIGSSLAVWGLRHRGKPDSSAELSRRIRRSAERLGTTYIKLAQIISAGEGVFPAELVNECKKCRDQVPPETYQTVVSTIEAEFGRPMHQIFRNFEPAPLAAASIAQVHAATLLTGEEVVVKVQRPDIDQVVYRDIRVLAWLGPLLVGRIPVSALANPPALVDLFAETIVEELDFRVEAANMLDVARVLLDIGQRSFVVPRPHPELVTQRVLVMERVSGFRFDDAVGMQAAGIDTEAVLKTGMLGFLEGAFLHGIFHGDLHGGNLFVMDDGRTALVDFGITGRLTQPERLAFLKMMMAATTNDVNGQVAALRDLGALPSDIDIEAVVKDLGLDGPPIDPTQLAPEELAAELRRILKALLAYGARMPKPLMLYVKNTIFLDGAIASLAPNLDMFAVLTEIATHFAVTHGSTIASQLGRPEDEWELDLYGLKASFGVDPATTDQFTYAELKERRELIRKRLSGRRLTQ